MKLKSAFLILIILTLLVGGLFAGCSGEQYPVYVDGDNEDAPTITVSIEIMGPDIELESDEVSSSLSDASGSSEVEDEEPGLIYRGRISVKSENPTVYMPTLKALIEADVSYSETAGQLDDFGGIPSTEDEAWVLYINGDAMSSDALNRVIEE